MFFRKKKRIKELELKIDTLEKDIIRFRSLLSRETLKFEIERPHIEICQAIDSFPVFFEKEVIDREIKHRLSAELYPFMRVEYDFDMKHNKYMARASIRVIKEVE